MIGTRLANEQLVPTSYVDAYRRTRTIEPEVRAAVLAAMGLGPDAEAPDGGHVVIGRPGVSLPEPGA